MSLKFKQNSFTKGPACPKTATLYSVYAFRWTCFMRICLLALGASLDISAKCRISPAWPSALMGGCWRSKGAAQSGVLQSGLGNVPSCLAVPGLRTVQGILSIRSSMLTLCKPGKPKLMSTKLLEHLLQMRMSMPRSEKMGLCPAKKVPTKNRGR